ncbi:14284_t:CDS:10, partial [Acaulospora morrowiae]
MSSLSDSISFSISTPSNSLPASYSQRESLIFDDSLSHKNLICPICNESMINLLQLNQHLDDVHTETTIEHKDSTMKWVKNAQTTIMKPLSKTKKLFDQFVANVTNGYSQSEFVTRDHWQKEGDNDQCSYSSCEKTLNLRNGKNNCRKCGKLFCDTHCHVSMKLNKQAQHDPVNGYWCRVCEDCFKSRDGYLDTEGVARSHSTTFTKLRTKGIERAHLEGNRLEKRLEKLAKVYATQTKQANNTQGGLKPPLTLKHRRRGIKLNFIRIVRSKRKRDFVPSLIDLTNLLFAASEQLIVKWEDDASVTNCPLCGTLFGKITNRKHHCRLCGRVVCEKCSSKISLNPNGNYSETPEQDSVGEVRTCKECRNAVFRRKEYNEETAKTPPVVMLYQKLSKIRSAIDSTLPKFQDMLVMLKSQEIINQTHADYQVAARTRKELLENFAQFDAISKKINSLL